MLKQREKLGNKYLFSHDRECIIENRYYKYYKRKPRLVTRWVEREIDNSEAIKIATKFFRENGSVILEAFSHSRPKGDLELVRVIDEPILTFYNKCNLCGNEIVGIFIFDNEEPLKLNCVWHKAIDTTQDRFIETWV